ncbi:hypothetical protein LSH36_235g02017 [Paralvinella palmiformis]|uniref:Uncharacterized protein n=1 Tax=Paralvinella palmiformis TaxID=53620 RepID=A0AAD9N4Z0_9ANNE|nr:hypothetical protein LSH36_235g02017 [Paralvinella palmiformis]
MSQEAVDDQFDWTRYTGGTPSAETGPQRAAEGRYYVYIEASRPRQLNDTATLVMLR